MTDVVSVQSLTKTQAPRASGCNALRPRTEAFPPLSSSPVLSGFRMSQTSSSCQPYPQCSYASRRPLLWTAENKDLLTHEHLVCFLRCRQTFVSAGLLLIFCPYRRRVCRQSVLARCCCRMLIIYSEHLIAFSDINSDTGGPPTAER